MFVIEKMSSAQVSDGPGSVSCAILCDLVKNSRVHVCSGMTVNNWSRGNIAEKFFQNSTECLAVLGNIVQYFEYMTAIINVHRLTNILTF